MFIMKQYKTKVIFLKIQTIAISLEEIENIHVVITEYQSFFSCAFKNSQNISFQKVMITETKQLFVESHIRHCLSREKREKKKKFSN